MDTCLNKKIGLVTGGAQGIGWAISLALAQKNIHVYLCDNSPENLAQATRQLTSTALKGTINLTLCDVTNRSAVNAWIKGIYQKNHRIDILVNNAAFVKWEEVTAMPIETAERIMQVGYQGMLYATKAVLEFMLPANQGHIINLGSCASQIFGGGTSAAYAATKAAIDAYTQVLQWELRKTNIAVTLIRPATVAGTDFFRKHVDSTILPRLADFIPYLTPPQVAHVVIKALQQRSTILDLPGYLPWFYFVFRLAPDFFRGLMTLGGASRRNYGTIQWQQKEPDS